MSEIEPYESVIEGVVLCKVCQIDGSKCVCAITEFYNQYLRGENSELTPWQERIVAELSRGFEMYLAEHGKRMA